VKTAALGFLVAVLLLASAGAHAFLGWPPFRALLAEAGVDASVAGALAAGWYFGSAAMACFGAIALHQAWRRARRRPVARGPLWVIAVVYLVYGTSAYALRELNPHFLLFVVTGSLVGCFALLCPEDRAQGG